MFAFRSLSLSLLFIVPFRFVFTVRRQTTFNCFFVPLFHFPLNLSLILILNLDSFNFVYLLLLFFQSLFVYRLYRRFTLVLPAFSPNLLSFSSHCLPLTSIHLSLSLSLSLFLSYLNSPSRLLPRPPSTLFSFSSLQIIIH
jgi:hypothetical protein